jgi:hypothetical protein
MLQMIWCMYPCWSSCITGIFTLPPIVFQFQKTLYFLISSVNSTKSRRLYFNRLNEFFYIFCSTFWYQTHQYQQKFWTTTLPSITGLMLRTTVTQSQTVVPFRLQQLNFLCGIYKRCLRLRYFKHGSATPGRMLSKTTLCCILLSRNHLNFAIWGFMWYNNASLLCYFVHFF